VVTQKADILVIGGGVIGLASAWRLAKVGKNVVLVEKETCGSGASLASLGALMPYAPGHSAPLAKSQQQSLWSYPEFVKELIVDTGIDPLYRKLGRLQLLNSDHQVDTYTLGAQIAEDEWPKQGSEKVIEVLSKDDAEKLEPEVLCSEFGAALCRNTAHISVEHLIAALRSACMKAGVDLRENCLAHELIVEDETVLGAHTSMGIAHAAITVLSAGAWSKSLLPSVDNDEQLLVSPVKGQAIMLQCKTPVLKHLVRGRGLYIVPIDRNRVLVGATKEANEGFDVTPTGDGLDALLQKVESMVPALSEAEVVKHWAGLRPQSEVRVPVVEPCETHKGLFVATGHGGIGICMLPAASQMVVDKILNT